LLSNERRIVRRLLPGKWVLIVVLAAISCAAALGVPETPPPLNEAAKSLPNSFDSFRSLGPVELRRDLDLDPTEVGLVSVATRTYRDTQNATFVIFVSQTRTDSGAYALLTKIADGKNDIKAATIGSAAIIAPSEVDFCKGPILVRVFGAMKAPAASDDLLRVAGSFAATLPSAENDVPVLVKHLPGWPAAAARAVYVVSLKGLEGLVPNQASLDVVNFDGGTEAVVANYAQSQLVIVEFTTPQFASDDDRRITAKIQELKNQGQPTPTGYRRVGNYSVFVFNAPDETTANALIDQVKYEQVVQWLGDDPHLYERVQRYVLQKTGGVVIAVLESSGLSILLCLGVGGLFGTLLFRRRRRARQRQGEAYSDAGGMVRLNLNKATEGEAARLLHGPDGDG
jgi:hypothetical protein